jgi:hypothetical protein
MPNTKPTTPTASLSDAFAAHDRMTADMDATQALIDRENEQLEHLTAQHGRARQARQSLYERLLNTLYTDDTGRQGEWPSYQAQQAFIRAHPDLEAAEARLEELEQEQAAIEARKQGLIRVWHQQQSDRAALRRQADNLEELRELHRQRRALEDDAAAIAALLEEKQKVMDAPQQPDDFPERRAALLASVALGEAGAKEALAALDKDSAARAASQAKQTSQRSETAQLILGLTAKRRAKQAEIDRARERERLALVWHLENEREAEQARHDDAERELHRAHLRIAALLNLTGADRDNPYPWLFLPNYRDTWDARAASRDSELERLASLGLEAIHS